MNAKILTLAIITLLAAETAFVQSAQAQGRSARFKFAPNVWRHEEPRVPATSSAPAVHNVRSGAVPKSKNFLGVNPQVLAKPKPAPQVQTQVAARPSAAVTKPAITHKTPAQFNPAFGKPQAMKAPVLAKAPVAAAPIARKAENLSLPKPEAKKAKSKPVSRKRSRNVRGRLKRPSSRKSLVAKAKSAPKVASYGKNVGYTAGPYVPVSSGSGMKTTSTVSGRLLK